MKKLEKLLKQSVANDKVRKKDFIRLIELSKNEIKEWQSFKKLCERLKDKKL